MSCCNWLLQPHGYSSINRHSQLSSGAFVYLPNDSVCTTKFAGVAVVTLKTVLPCVVGHLEGSAGCSGTTVPCVLSAQLCVFLFCVVAVLSVTYTWKSKLHASGCH
jgi:hypothetical protein